MTVESPDFLPFIQAHNLAVERLTEHQLADVLRQAMASGDFIRIISHDGRHQGVTYVPYREAERLRTQYHELLNAVSRKYEGETRHETALRYIVERENIDTAHQPAKTTP